MYVIVGKVFFNQISLVPKANYEIIDTIVAVNFHNVPQYWPTSDLDQWFWLQGGFFGKSSPVTARQNHRPVDLMLHRLLTPGLALQRVGLAPRREELATAPSEEVGVA